MIRCLSDLSSDRDNNFNLIRFVAALMVLISHGFALAVGSPDVEPLRDTLGMSLGEIAVDVFFISSGFLITASLTNRSSFLSFALARVLRIFPALIVAMLLTVFVLGPLYTDYSFFNYLGESQVYIFLVRNIFLLVGIEYGLPGVFLENPYKEAINGSLWTLPYELKMYMLLVVFNYIAVVSKSRYSLTFNSRILFFVLVIVSYFFDIFDHFFDIHNSHFVHLFSMFFVGSVFYMFREKIFLSVKFLLIASIALIFSSLNKDVFFLLYVLLIPYFVFCLAYLPRGKIRLFNNFGDYSYGLYIYAFPVQQAVAASFVGVSITLMIILSLFFTLLLSILSWYLVEEKCLKLKGRSVVFVKNIMLKKQFLNFQRNR